MARDLKQHPCPHCGVSYSLAGLKAHVRMKHEGAPPPVVHRADQKAKREAEAEERQVPDDPPRGDESASQPTPPASPPKTSWLDRDIFADDEDDE